MLRLPARHPTPERRALLRGAMQLLDTANLWFGEGKRTGAYQVRSVDQVIKASRPWRARLKAFADQAFAFEPDVAEQFADVNTSGTLTEESSDLAMLLRLGTQHQAAWHPSASPRSSCGKAAPCSTR